MCHFKTSHKGHHPFTWNMNILNLSVLNKPFWISRYCESNFKVPTICYTDLWQTNWKTFSYCKDTRICQSGIWTIELSPRWLMALWSVSTHLRPLGHRAHIQPLPCKKPLYQVLLSNYHLGKKVGLQKKTMITKNWMATTTIVMTIG